MAYLSDSQLTQVGFSRVGIGVQISDRAVFHDPQLQVIGDFCRIDDFCVVSGRVWLGRNVHVALFCNLSGGRDGLVLSDFSGISYGCQLFTQSDDFSGSSLTNPTVSSVYRTVHSAPVTIGRHAILGAHSVVLPGVEIAEGCALGAMTLATESTEPWGLYTGVPARRVRDRSRALLDLERGYLNTNSPPS